MSVHEEAAPFRKGIRCVGVQELEMKRNLQHDDAAASGLPDQGSGTALFAAAAEFIVVACGSVGRVGVSG
jgi:hypothetical protein